MLSLVVLIPLAGALILAAAPIGERGARGLALGITALPLLLLLIVWAGFQSGAGFQAVNEMPWIPALGIGWRLGVDGISLALSLMTAVIFLAALAWPMGELPRPRGYYAWMLFLAGVSLGLFLALDMIVFYLFFDLSLVGMYFLIGRWGHGEAQHAAFKFFVYTLVGSLLVLLGILVLALSMSETTFDMRRLIAEAPLGAGVVPSLVLLAFVVGFGIKTPLFPFHTWLPPAHVDAPGPVSAILAGVLLKMGTYGLVRFPLQMMPQAFAEWAWAIAALAVISILWGAVVALGQSNLKRRIAYTSVNHMGYAVLGIAAAGASVGAQTVQHAALTGAVLEMIAHGFITGSLFLMAGAFWQRRGDYEMGHYGGLAVSTPRFTGAMALASFASFGLPGLAGFVAELHIFYGAFGTFPWLAAVGLLGLLITAALFLQMLRVVFFGEPEAAALGFGDLSAGELAAVAGLLALVVLIGVWPGWLIDLIGAGGALPVAWEG